MNLDAYRLPEGKVQISFSGGRTSAYMLHHIAEANGGIDPTRVEVVFSNTGREMPATLDFVAEVGSRWQIPITWVEYRRGKPGFEIVGRQGASEDGAPFRALIEARKYLPNQQARFCTQELKIRPAKRYLVALGWDHWTCALGIRADEQRRIKEERLRERWVRWYPLNDAGVTKHDVAAFWRAQPFDLRLQNIRGTTPFGNCDGCFLKSERNLAALAREMPERHQWWEDMESLVCGLTQGDGGRWSKRYTRASLRRFVEDQGDWIFSAKADEAGVLCQADGGECTE